MKELTRNERARRGIPALAITNDRAFSGSLEGFDRNGLYWYKTASHMMEPGIRCGTYLCLRPVRPERRVFGLNGEVYVLAVRRRGGVETLMGNVTERRGSDGGLTLHATHPFPHGINIDRADIVEAYVAIYALNPLPEAPLA